jgi:hypothetical protein
LISIFDFKDTQTRECFCHTHVRVQTAVQLHDGAASHARTTIFFATPQHSLDFLYMGRDSKGSAKTHSLKPNHFPYFLNIKNFDGTIPIAIYAEVDQSEVIQRFVVESERTLLNGAGA